MEPEVDSGNGRKRWVIFYPRFSNLPGTGFPFAVDLQEISACKSITVEVSCSDEEPPVAP